jgi:hypothetical protein
MENERKNKTCVRCKTALRRFSVTTDWGRRDLHKKCYHILNEERILKSTLELYIATLKKSGHA